MGRFLGSSNNRTLGLPGGGVAKNVSFSRSGITTDADNNVTSVTLGDSAYSNVAYNTVGLITSFTETVNGTEKSWEVDYNTTTWLANSITEVN
tara:strand:- start:1486 stop:1764 length:279 start_codon:yes stop_codon:yes gene_type:complete